MHECPDCGQACTCNGDVEDLMWSDDSLQAICCIHVDLTYCDEPGDPNEDDWQADATALLAEESKP